jgi:hypothetical protein
LTSAAPVNRRKAKTEVQNPISNDSKADKKEEKNSNQKENDEIFQRE